MISVVIDNYGWRAW